MQSSRASADFIVTQMGFPVSIEILRAMLMLAYTHGMRAGIEQARGMFERQMTSEGTL